MESVSIILAVIILALLFELTNGWNDAANAIATIVSTRVLKPRTAVLLSASFNVLGALLSTKVAATVSGLVNAQMIAPSVIAAAMISGALWNMVMTRAGMPISASHALLGSVTGAAVAAAGTGVLNWSIIMKAVHGLWSSPLIGLVVAIALAYPLLRLVPRLRLPLAAGIVVALSYLYSPWIALATLTLVLFIWLWASRSGKDHDAYWRGYQLVSSSLMSLAHGTNDAQKVMGVITLALIAGQLLPAGSAPPLWVILSCAVTMGIGTYLGGWEVIKTLGEKLTDLKPIHGFAAETAGAAVLTGAAHLGIPVSTTHTITGTIMGVGVAKGKVNWRVASKIVMAWVFTIPTTFVVGFLLSAAIAWSGLWPVVAAVGGVVAAVEVYLRLRGAARIRLAEPHAECAVAREQP